MVATSPRSGDRPGAPRRARRARVCRRSSAWDAWRERAVPLPGAGGRSARLVLIALEHGRLDPLELIAEPVDDVRRRRSASSTAHAAAKGPCSASSGRVLRRSHDLPAIGARRPWRSRSARRRVSQRRSRALLGPSMRRSSPSASGRPVLSFAGWEPPAASPSRAPSHRMPRLLRPAAATRSSAPLTRTAWSHRASLRHDEAHRLDDSDTSHVTSATMNAGTMLPVRRGHTRPGPRSWIQGPWRPGRRPFRAMLGPVHSDLPDHRGTVP